MDMTITSRPTHHDISSILSERATIHIFFTHFLSYSHTFQPENLLTTLNLQEIRSERNRDRDNGVERDRNAVTIFQSRKKVMCNLIASLRFQVFPLFIFLSVVRLLASSRCSNPFNWKYDAVWIVKLNLIFYAHAMDQKFEWHFIIRCHSIKYIFL